MLKKTTLVCCSLSLTLTNCILTQPSCSLGQEVNFPDNANVVDVRKQYNAKGDGITDDTAAIQQALNSENRLVYLANGTYLVCGTIAWGSKRRILQGQSRDKTIIKLKNNCPGFGDAANPKPLITVFEGKSTGVAFRNSIYDLTVDVGSGNQGAIGIRFINNNQGGLRNVEIRSSDADKRGAIALALTKKWPGPSMIKNLRIVGFDYGIKVNHPEYSLVFEDLVLNHQRVLGIENNANVLSIRGLTSENLVPVIKNADARGLVVVLDGNFRGGASANCAIANEQGVLYARNIQTSGYRSAIENQGRVVPGNAVSEYVSQDIYHLFPNLKKSLSLPVAEVPTVSSNNLKDWVSVTQYGAISGDNQDDTAAIQKAIDSGQQTVYFPYGSYLISDTIHVRGNVKQIIGMESVIQAKGKAFNASDQPVFRIEAGKSQVVVLERFWAAYGSNAKYWVEQAASRTLVLKNIMFGGYRNTVPGRLFIEDVTGAPWEFNRQTVWARQLNPEGNRTKIVNNGSTVWILGLKTEDAGTAVETLAGGKTEILGGLLYPGSPKIPEEQPAFINDDSQLSVVIVESHYGNGGRYKILVKEVKNGMIKTLPDTDLPQRGSASIIPLYIGF